MSRVAKSPLLIPDGTEASINGNMVNIQGGKSSSKEYLVDKSVKVTKNDNQLWFEPINGMENSDAYAGTARALIKNILSGMKQDFEKKLVLVGVGYRAQLKEKKLQLSLGFSHPVIYQLPEGVIAEIPSQTEIIIKGQDKQKVGQVASEIRAFRPPEPYKGKGVRYSDEQIIRKEGKKK